MNTLRDLTNVASLVRNKILAILMFGSLIGFSGVRLPNRPNENSFGNPLIPDMVADPSIIEVDGTFYCFVTTDGYGHGLETSGPPVVWKSKDFVNWSFEGTYFPQAENEKYWAPSKAVEYNGKWFIYPTVNGYMYPAVADAPDGPYRLAKGDSFELKNRLFEKDSICAIDTEIFIDDDGSRYALWGLRNIARLKEDMVTIDSLAMIPTRLKTYTEGPIFFKRKGIYYYLYTNMALEKYEYFYQMSHESPFGPYVTPKQDIVCTTNPDTGVFGPGHGCVFNPEGTDDWYLVFLEFSRNSTNRQIYVNKLEFNKDGTIRQVNVDLNGVGALRPMKIEGRRIDPLYMTASSVADPETIPYKLDKRCQRTEYFIPEFAADRSNGSRWMAASGDSVGAWLTADIGRIVDVGQSKIYFVRPTAGHAYSLEGSIDGVEWFPCGGHDDLRKMSPHCDKVNRSVRYLRVTISDGIPGVWEWVIEERPTQDFANAEWIAAEKDSTVIFPHIHLLKAKSPEAKSLKQYTLPVLRKSVRLSGKVKKAWIDVCGLGQYELFIDNRKVGDKFLTPGWTMYDKDLLYNEFDVTDLLKKKSKKAVELKAMLGGGMYDIPVKGYHKMAGSCGAPKMLLCLHIEYENGDTEDIVSDGSWTVEDSPVRYSSIYAGEWHDANVKSEPRPVEITRPYFDVPLVKQSVGTLVHVAKELPSHKISEKIYDMGQNCSGIVRIKVKGKKGGSVVLRPAEILKNGEINQKSLPGYEWKYTLSGDKKGEEWQPQFTYTGFRYVEVTPDPDVEVLELTGLHTTADIPEVGHFECSDTLFNRIHSLIDWAIRSNLASITTDCPTREKLGWQEQNHLMAHSMMYRYDMRDLFNKIADDLADSQHADGAIPTIAPEYTAFEPGSGFEDTPEWGASFILIPWYAYLWYGDDSAIRTHYHSMKRYIDYLGSRTQDGILDYGLGDWFDIGPQKPGKAQLTSVALTATAMCHYELRVMEKIARMLGKEEDALRFAETADKTKDSFNRRFLSGDDKVYENGSQTGLAMALYMDLVPDDLRSKTIDALVRDIEDRGFALTAGDVGFRYVVQALQQNGRSDVIYKMNRNDSIPGYAYQLKKGATALTESWQAYDDVSNNHLMLGHLMEWLYSGLGGISFNPDVAMDEAGSGWRNIVIDPQPVGDVKWAKTSLNTPNGPVECNWHQSDDGKWEIDVNIPSGSKAEIRLPDGSVEHTSSGSYHFKGE